jgi:hypothetical protein
MVEIRFAAFSQLAAVRTLGERIGARDESVGILFYEVLDRHIVSIRRFRAIKKSA